MLQKSCLGARMAKKSSAQRSSISHFSPLFYSLLVAIAAFGAQHASLSRCSRASRCSPAGMLASNSFVTSNSSACPRKVTASHVHVPTKCGVDMIERCKKRDKYFTKTTVSDSTGRRWQLRESYASLMVPRTWRDVLGHKWTANDTGLQRFLSLVREMLVYEPDQRITPGRARCVFTVGVRRQCASFLRKHAFFCPPDTNGNNTARSACAGSADISQSDAAPSAATGDLFSSGAGGALSGDAAVTRAGARSTSSLLATAGGRTH